METQSSAAQTRAPAAGTAESHRRSARYTARDAAEPSLVDTADQALRSVQALYRQVQASVQNEMEEAPYATLGIAAGIGFIVGGGLASPLGQALVRQSLRAFGPPLLQSALSAALAADRPQAVTLDDD